MAARYILAPQAAEDLVEIWHYIKTQSSEAMADRVESVILSKIVTLAQTPGLGHTRKNLTNAPVKFFSVYSYIIVYLPESKPLEVVSILHGYRDVEGILKVRL